MFKLSNCLKMSEFVIISINSLKDMLALFYVQFLFVFKIHFVLSRFLKRILYKFLLFLQPVDGYHIA